MREGMRPASTVENVSCPICESESRKFSYFRADKGINGPGTSDYVFVCARCGRYETGPQFEAHAKDEREILGEMGSVQRGKLSAWIRHNYNPYFDRDFLRKDMASELRSKSLDSPGPSFHQKADDLLLVIERNTQYAGMAIDIDPLVYPNWLAESWAVNQGEYHELIKFLEKKCLIEHDSSLYEVDYMYRITPDGWLRLQALHDSILDSSQGFVAMWFDPQIKTFYDEVIVKAISEAGYKPWRSDLNHYNDRIDHRIEYEIKRSKFVLADFTGHRGGVYFEAGFARALGKVTIYTCRGSIPKESIQPGKDESHKEDKTGFDDLHFDVRQFPCLTWPPDLLTRPHKETEIKRIISDIRDKILDLCGQGPLVPKATDN